MAKAFEVTDSRTRKVVAKFGTSVAAMEFADRKDNAFGAVRFTVSRNNDVFSDDEFETFMVRVRAERAAA